MTGAFSRSRRRAKTTAESSCRHGLTAERSLRTALMQGGGASACRAGDLTLVRKTPIANLDVSRRGGCPPSALRPAPDPNFLSVLGRATRRDRRFALALPVRT
jgi:hypothetical protein